MKHAANSRLQQTLADPVELQGTGLFHGIPGRVRLIPSDVNTGIIFCRTDLIDFPTVSARYDFVLKSHRRTVLGHGKTPLVETVEHLMAALAGLGVDNCRIEIDVPEIPSFDTSSRVFCDAILETGLQQLSDPIKTFDVASYITQQTDGGESLILRPYLKPVMAVTCQVDYGPRAVVPAQIYSTEITADNFVREIAAARTFVLESEISALKGLGYGQHLTEQDLLVCRGDGTWNQQLRWPNECARHKLLDCVGDLALIGTAVRGHVSAIRSGHELNHKLAAKVAHLAGGMSQHLSTAA